MNILNFLDPINLEQERNRFFQDDKYNPTFHYRWENEKVLIKTEDVKSSLFQAIISQSRDKIDKYASLYFNTDLNKYLDIAQEITKNKPKSLKRPNTEEVVSIFKKAFRFLNLDDYSLQISDLGGFNFRPSPSFKKIIYSKHADLQYFSIEEEVKHELCHVVRFENGKFNNIEKSHNSLPTEEGLATYISDKVEGGNASKFQHAAEYIASVVGREGSLRDIYDYFVNIGFNTKLAWQRACRHKFGFIDTSLPGDIIKPAMYFANSQLLYSLTQEQIIKLFVGRISLGELDKINKYSGIIAKEKIVEFFL